MVFSSRPRRSVRAGGGALEQELALARVARQRSRALALSTCLVEAVELGEEIATHGRQQVVALERRLRDQRVDERESRGRTECHGDRDRTIELHDRRWRELN